MAIQAGLRTTGQAYVVSSSPDVCLTPPGPTPVPYMIMARLSDAQREEATVRFRGYEAVTMDSRVQRVQGDEAGVGGGVVSATHMGMCKPITSSSSVHVGGHLLLYNTTQMWMNCLGPEGQGNTIGNVVFVEGPPGASVSPDGVILGAMNPPVVPETEEEKGFFGRMFDKAKDLAEGAVDAVLSDPMAALHTALDVAGMIPVVGEIADGVNAAIYLAEGDYTNAALSAAAMVPVAGMAATAGKLALRHGGRAADVANFARRHGDQIMDTAEAVLDPLGAIAGRAIAAGGRTAGRLAHRARNGVNGATILGRRRARPGRGSDRHACDKAKCTAAGEPVDVATGQVYTAATDFALPGPRPFTMARSWFSTSQHEGLLGHGWHCALDQALLVNEAHGTAIVRLTDGRLAEFDLPQPGQRSYNRFEQRWLVAEVAAEDLLAYGDGLPGPPPTPAPTDALPPARPDARVVRYRLTDAYGDGPVFERDPGLPYGTYWRDAEASGQAWRLARLEDRNGNAVRLRYDEQGHLAEIVDSAGRGLAVETDRAGRLLEIAGPDPDGGRRPHVLVQYAYDDAGDLIVARDALGHPERYVYEGHLLVKTVFRSGVAFYWAYEGRGPDARCVRTWGDPLTTGPEAGLHRFDYRFAYDLEHRITTLTDARGAVSTYAFNELGLIEEETDELGQVWRTKWDLRTGNKKAATDPLGRTTRFHYDGAGRLAGIDLPDGTSQGFAYDEAGRSVAFVDPLGHAWTRALDAQGNVVASADPEGAEVAYERDARGLPLAVTDPLGHTARLTWDAAGNLVRLVDRMGAVTELAYDPLGRLVRRTDPDGARLRFRYDPAGRLVRADRFERASRGTLASAGTLVAAYRYDAAGLPTEVTDAAGRTLRLAYEAFGPEHRLAAVVAPSGAETRYAYDFVGFLASVTDAAGRTWRLERDAVGQLTAETDFTGRTLRYAYDAAGRLATTTDARGRVARLERDRAGRVVRRVLAAGTAQETAETFAYDAAGRLLAASNEAVAIGFAYDACGRITAEWQRLTGDAEALAVRHAYDAAGRRVGRASDGGRRLDFAYDACGRLTRIADEFGALAEIQRDRTGREVRRALPGGLVSRRSYTPVGALAEQRLERPSRPGRPIEQAVLMSRRYTYDAAGLMTAAEDGRWGTTRFEHDADGRLVGAAYEGLYPERAAAPGLRAHIERFAYDAAGNVPAAPVRLPSQAAEDGGVVATRVVDGWTLGYDADGHLLSKRDTARRRGGVAWRYVYDAVDRLAEVWRDDGAAGERCVGRYAYDPLGRRVRRATEAGAVRTRWDGDVPLAEAPLNETRPTSEPLAEEYVFEGFRPTAVLRADAPADDHVLEVDHIGAPRASVDRSGRLVWEGMLDAWGRVAAESGGSAPRFRFPGQVGDAESGLSYNRFRYYDPAVRAYTQADPIGLAGGLHPHGYVGDPTSWTDPLGLAHTHPNNNHKQQTGYETNDVDAHGLLSPQTSRAPGHSNTRADRFVQSHHPVQDAWAQANVPGYSRNDAPAVLLRSASGEPHAAISAAQRARRRALKAQGADPWSTSIREEFGTGYREMVDAGVPVHVARRAIGRSYKYFDSLGAFN